MSVRRQGNPETAVVAAAMKLLPMRFPGCKIWRANSGGNKSGRKHNSINLVDVVGWQRAGMALAVEVKNDVGFRIQLTQAQFDFLKDVHGRGGYAGVFTEIGLFDFENIPAKHLPAKPRAK